MFKTKEELAGKAIEYFLKTNKKLLVNKGNLPLEWQDKRACFVTLKINEELRGCIGSVIPFEPLSLNIIRNAISAGFYDPRFPPLQEKEFSKLTIEVSVLSIPEKYQPENPESLLKFLKKERPGLIIEKEGQKALFLPQVWEELADPRDFLTHLCLKAGLDANSWKANDLKYQIFKIK